MKTLERSSLILRGNPERVLCRMFIPGEEDLIHGRSRIPDVLERALSLSEEDVVKATETFVQLFSERHRDLSEQCDAHFRAVEHLIDEPISHERKVLIGAYFTQEYAIEGAAYFNPSIVLAPDNVGSPHENLRFILSVRAVGEGHISTIVFRSGSLTADGVIQVDPASPYASTRANRFTVLRNRLVHQASLESGVDCAELELALAMLPDKFTPEDLITSLTQLDLAGSRHTPSDALIRTVDDIARSSYEVDFPKDSELSERVLWPIAPDERRGMEDARFVRILDDDEPVRYRASYTAFDGSSVKSRVLETDDFRSFSSMALTGSAVRNKGLAFFPRRVDGSYCALSRFDRESNSITYSSDGYHWNDVEPLAKAKEPWELVHMGNCGSPIEIDEGFLVLTHGAGPMRRYCMGAMLLDKENPRKVIGRMAQPLLEPQADERNGYVPNVVYSCGSLLNGGRLVIPYGVSDWHIRFVTVEVEDILHHLT
jgi:predicted GH43/DUF377 family glycosyl hydrolase